MSRDYRQTVFLPNTAFPMKANLPAREPDILTRWQQQNLYRRMRDAAAGREKFVLHDGPPYANGEIHTGTAMNKILKDVICRAQQMVGKDAPYVPGWDCHGLPIEWKIEEAFRKEGRNKEDIPPAEFRAKCRAFAAKWIEVQKEQFQRLGVVGDWENPYTTMAFDAEASIVAELLKFVADGRVYRGARPVMWSVVENTALAEAEIEYHDHTSTTIDVAFPVVKGGNEHLKDAAAVIWTTTPWTIPGNRAIVYRPDFEYSIIAVKEVGEGSRVEPGARLLVASELVDEFCARAGITASDEESRFPGTELSGVICRHPWHGRGYDFEVPLLPGDHVTLDQGTGLVHTAPGHGAEDFEVGQQFGLETPYTVTGEGLFAPGVPLVEGVHVFKADNPICDLLDEAGALLARGKLLHSYPHSWRSKAPLIFRNTPQWFISMETGDLRDTALKAIDEVRWVPERSRRRIQSMVADRPDWVISRQRAWGVPLTLFVSRESGDILVDADVNERILAAVRKEGADAWFARDPQELLGNQFDADDYEQVTDILDVWFDSGSTHAFVLEQRDELKWPASLYLEGSDQHRGWFQSSLLESCGTRGRAPYEAVLTHGFVQDAEGRKMSKSLGNVVSPQKVIEQNGADILRLWVVSTDYFEDVRIGGEILKGQVDAYRKIRNTLRFLLSNLNDFTESEALPDEEMPELERWILHRVRDLDASYRRHVDGFDFNPIYQALYQFCIQDLSSLYFDIRKDCLYCDPANSIKRRAARTVLDRVFHYLTGWLAPILVFTSDEAWVTRFGEDKCVHLRWLDETPGSWRNDALAAKWNRIRALRRVVTGALEIDRREKRIGSSLESCPTIYLSDQADRDLLQSVDFAEITITSAINLSMDEPPEDAFTLEEVPGVAVKTAEAEGEKCQRCWRILPEVATVTPAKDLCSRCSDAISDFDWTKAAS